VVVNGNAQRHRILWQENKQQGCGRTHAAKSADSPGVRRLRLCYGSLTSLRRRKLLSFRGIAFWLHARMQW
jgi:hypothetical protein